MGMIDWDQLNVINAAKAWYRGIMQGVPWRDEVGRRRVIEGLPAPLRRLALMTAHLLAEEKKKAVPRRLPPGRGRKTKSGGRGHLRVVR